MVNGLKLRKTYLLMISLPLVSRKCCRADFIGNTIGNTKNRIFKPFIGVLLPCCRKY